MKYLKISFLVFILIASGSAISSCGSHSAETEKQAKEYTSIYVCPMHCDGSGSEEAGTCPVCGMEYVKNEDHKADGHQHEDH